MSLMDKLKTHPLDTKSLYLLSSYAIDGLDITEDLIVNEDSSKHPQWVVFDVDWFCRDVIGTSFSERSSLYP